MYFRFWNNLKTAVLHFERRQMAPRLPDGPETAYRMAPRLLKMAPRLLLNMAPSLPMSNPHGPETAYEMAPATIYNCPETACIWPQDCRMAQKLPVTWLKRQPNMASRLPRRLQDCMREPQNLPTMATRCCRRTPGCQFRNQLYVSRALRASATVSEALKNSASGCPFTLTSAAPSATREMLFSTARNQLPYSRTLDDGARLSSATR